MPALNFLIIDGYPKESREQFMGVGMRLAGQLFADMMKQHRPDAKCDIIYPCDPGVMYPVVRLADYMGIMWSGSNLTIYNKEDKRVAGMIEFSKKAYEAGVPQFGSCWGIQMAAVAAGGEVKANLRGREMAIARMVYITKAGQRHPMYEGKPPVFNGFVSHDDEVTKLPKGAVWTASNDFTKVQGLAVKHKKGVFWATQYHAEYNLHEMARLIIARKEKLTELGFFEGDSDFESYVNNLETLYKEPGRKDLRWQLAIESDLLDDSIRQVEFVNWVNKIVLPYARKKGVLK